LPPHEQGLTGLQRQVVVQAAPGRDVDLGDGRQLGIAAVAGTARTAHDGDDGGAGRELVAGIGLDPAGALDAGHRCQVARAPVTHVELGAVEAEGPVAGEHLAAAGTESGNSRIWRTSGPPW
jgi:hypothetical protein